MINSIANKNKKMVYFLLRKLRTTKGSAVGSLHCISFDKGHQVRTQLSYEQKEGNRHRKCSHVVYQGIADNKIHAFASSRKQKLEVFIAAEFTLSKEKTKNV